MHLQGLVLVACGLFSVVAASQDWDWFMNHRKARLFVALFGRTGARLFYAGLGAVLMALGAVVTLGMLD
jgi:hypothetical protein